VARDLRQYPSQESDGAWRRGRGDNSLSVAGADVDLRCGDALPQREGSAGDFSPARNTAAARRAIGAAKGVNLLGVRAVITQSFERIHRSNLIGMGVLPLVFEEGTSWQSLGLKGSEQVTIRGLQGELKPHQRLMAEIIAADGRLRRIPLICRIDNPGRAGLLQEWWDPAIRVAPSGGGLSGGGGVSRARWRSTGRRRPVSRFGSPKAAPSPRSEWRVIAVPTITLGDRWAVWEEPIDVGASSVLVSGA